MQIKRNRNYHIISDQDQARKVVFDLLHKCNLMVQKISMNDVNPICGGVENIR